MPNSSLRQLSRRAFAGEGSAATVATAILTSTWACRNPRDNARPPIRGLGYGTEAASQNLDVYFADGGGNNGGGGAAKLLLILVHGGGWVQGSKADLEWMIPRFTERGCCVVNVSYRLAGESPAPAAAVDLRNAVCFIEAHAREWKCDGAGIVLAGFSAGAHLALVAALAPDGGGWIGGRRSKVSGIVSFWGITDVQDLLAGRNARDFALRWMPSGASAELVRALSPVSYDLSKSAPLPALCAIHSTQDDVVPFSHSDRLVAQYRDAGGAAEFMRLSHAGHGAPKEEYDIILPQLFGFLSRHRILA